MREAPITHLSVKDLSVTRGGQSILQDISFTATAGEFIGLIGPNGAGKTSLMRAIVGLLPHGGDCSLASLSPAAKARTVSWLPQARDVAWPISVEALVMLGRHPYPSDTKEDAKAVKHALEEMALSHLATRPATTLSGGETARALIARCLAQSTKILLADEPLAGLDMAHQLSVLELFRTKADRGELIISSIHDVGLAARYCTRFILVGHQSLLGDGTPEEIINNPLFSEVFNIEIMMTSSDDGPMFMPKKRLS